MIHLIVQDLNGKERISKAMMDNHRPKRKSPKNVQRSSHLRMNRIIRCRNRYHLLYDYSIEFQLGTSTSSKPKKLWLEYEVKKPIAFEAKKVMTVLS